MKEFVNCVSSFFGDTDEEEPEERELCIEINKHARLRTHQLQSNPDH
jgi:hypothetical protein